ncbi:MAG: hypothetical protein ACLFQX_11975 [Candidatus Kapaibacterium sp.]
MGGPVAAAIAFFSNFKTLDEDNKALVSIIGFPLFAIAYFALVWQLPDAIIDSIPPFLSNLILLGIVIIVYKYAMASHVAGIAFDHETTRSGWNVAGLIFLGLIVELVVFVGGFFYFMDMDEEARFAESAGPITLNYGKMNHTFVMEKPFINSDEAETIGDLLTKYEYFNDDEQKEVLVDADENKLYLTLYNKNFRNSPIERAKYKHLKKELENTLDRKVLLLIEPTSDGSTTIFI